MLAFLTLVCYTDCTELRSVNERSLIFGGVKCTLK